MHRHKKIHRMQCEGHGLSEGYSSSSFKGHSVIENILEDNDEVFTSRSEDVLDGPDFNAQLLRKGKQERQRLDSTIEISENNSASHGSVCSAKWSVSNRCIDCAWKAQRGGRPHHPAPPNLSPPPIVTLQSLSTTRDSGYEPSPTSAFSFTFTSDEDDNQEDDESDITYPPQFAIGGITPPINIPPSTKNCSISIRSSRASSTVRSRHLNKLYVHTAHETDRTPIIPRIRINESQPVAVTTTNSFTKTAIRKRSKSAPEFGGNELLLPKTGVTLRNGNLFRTPLADCATTPIHGRNYSLPATTPDGTLLAPPPSTPSSRASRERLIDLTEEDPEGSSGHRRRVLVLALPDLLIDANRRPPSPSEESTAWSTWSRESSCSSSTSVQSSRLFSFPPPKDSISDNNSGVESSPILRPVWRRPRALSCDVTLEVEIGQDLRKIADTFEKNAANSRASMWRTIRDSFGRRFSLGVNLPIPEDGTPQSFRGTQSLPCTPIHAQRNDSDFDEDSEHFEWL